MHSAVGATAGSPPTTPSDWRANSLGDDADPVDVRAFHDAALRAGAKDEGEAGPRGWQPHAYAKYVRDFDGN